MRKALAALAALVIGLLMMAAPSFGVGNSGDASCTTGNYSGNTTNGSWTRGYKPSCTGTTSGTVSVYWGNYTDSNGGHHIWWYATVSAGAIASNYCIEVALDWHNPQGGHSDAQYARNCFENSSYTTTTQDLHTSGYSGASNWYVQRLQIGLYDGGSGTVSNVVCPGQSGAPGLTDTDASCTDWLHLGAATWNSKAAKIYRRDNSGNDNNNDPFYGIGGTYTINSQTDPNN